jgi:hypothetical protein
VRALLTPRWLARHALAVALALACAGLTWWQVSRALGGNILSYGYALLWPVFGIFVLIIWVREMRLATGGTPAAPPAARTADGFGRPIVSRPVPAQPVTAATDTEPDGDDLALTEYNRLLAWLAAHPGARPADYREEIR